MDFYSEKDFAKILKHNAQSQRHQNLSVGTDVFRIYDRNLSDFPVTVDLYSSYARIVDFGEEPFSEEDRSKCLDIVSRYAYVDLDKIVYSYRQKLDKTTQHEKTELEPIIVNVKENGLTFKTDLSSYTDTGLFLDHVNTRKFIKENSCEKDVLNLFSYTGSFSVYAASGLSKSVTSVDLSATYTKWAEENLKLNGYEGSSYPCICMDALKFVQSKIDDKTKYDIIIFDPPSFSNSHKMEHDFDVQRDHVFWLRKLVSLLRRDGFILFSTNLSVFRIDKKALKGLNIREITAQMWADGFVKGRKGTVRSWIMSIDDDSLTLDWSEDKHPSEVKKERRDYGSKRNFSEDRPRRRNDSRDFHKRDGYGHLEDRPRRRYEDSEDRPRRNFDRPVRRYEEDSENRPRRSFDERHSFNDSPRHYSEERPRRRYEDSEERPRRSFRDKEEHPRSERPRREFSDRRTERHSERSEYKRPEGSSGRHSKPYGYESFKPARNRNDSSDFFWNSDDLKSDN